MPRGTSTTPAVLMYLADRVGLAVSVQDMVKDLQLSKTQIQRSVRMLQQNGENVTDLVSGNVWRYSPGSKREGPELYEQVGRTRKGVIIVQDEQGDIYFLHTEPPQT